MITLVGVRRHTLAKLSSLETNSAWRACYHVDWWLPGAETVSLFIPVLDAMGKVPSGITAGNNLWVGSWHTCRKIHAVKNTQGYVECVLSTGS